MKGKRLIIIGVVAAVIMAVSATATTFAFDSRFDKLDWTKYGNQAYGYAAARGAPNTGDGAAVAGSTTMREWLIIGIAAGAALTAGGVSLTLLRKRQS